MYTKKLLIIGAGFLQTFVIKKAKELGYYVLVVDGNAKAEGFAYADESEHIDIIDERACLEYAKKKNIDGVMTAATDFGVLTVAYIAQELGLPGLNFNSANIIKNKFLVRTIFYENKVDDTEQSYEIKQITNVNSLRDKLHYPVMVKPCDGSGSRGASKVSNAEELEMACQYAICNSLSNRAEIETFIAGQEYGVESFVENGNIHVLAVMRKWMTEPPYYAELGHAIPSGLSDEFEGKIKKCVKKAIKALKINFGAVNMDLIVTDEGNIHIVDVGARMGGNLIGSHIVRLGTGVDYLANLIRATVDDRVNMEPICEKTKVATRLLALSPGKVIDLPNFEKIAVKHDVEIQHHLHMGDVINEYHTNLDGCGYIISTSKCMKTAIEKAVKAKDEINYEIQRG